MRKGSFRFFLVFGIVLAAASSACADIQYDNATSGTVAGNSTITVSHTIGNFRDRILIVGVEAENGTAPTITTITYNGVTMTKIDSEENTSTAVFMHVELWYMLETNLPAAGAHNVVVTAGGTYTDINVGAISIYNAKQQAPEATSKNSSLASDTVATTLTTLTNGDMVVDAVGCGNATASTVAEATRRYNQLGSTSEGAGSTRVVAAAGSATNTWTNAGANRMDTVMAAFAPKPADVMAVQ